MKDVTDPIEGNAWIKDERLRKKFWATLKGEGYTEKQIHDALKVDSVKQYEGSFDDAIEGVRRVGEFTEARFTGTWKGPHRGGEVFYCVRDEDDKKGSERLEALMPSVEDEVDAFFSSAQKEPAQQTPTEDASEQPDMGPPPEEKRKDYCYEHKKDMKRREKRDGSGHYYDHREEREDGWYVCYGNGWKKSKSY